MEGLCHRSPFRLSHMYISSPDYDDDDNDDDEDDDDLLCCFISLLSNSEEAELRPAPARA